MNENPSFSPDSQDRMTRLVLCAVIGAAAVYAADKLCQGKNIPLWNKYGPWIRENQIQAIALLAAALYGASLALWPEGPAPGPEEGYSPCT